MSQTTKLGRRDKI